MKLEELKNIMSSNLKDLVEMLEKYEGIQGVMIDDSVNTRMKYVGKGRVLRVYVNPCKFISLISPFQGELRIDAFRWAGLDEVEKYEMTGLLVEMLNCTEIPRIEETFSEEEVLEILNDQGVCSTLDGRVDLANMPFLQTLSVELLIKLGKLIKRSFQTCI